MRTTDALKRSAIAVLSIPLLSAATTDGRPVDHVHTGAAHHAPAVAPLLDDRDESMRTQVNYHVNGAQAEPAEYMIGALPLGKKAPSGRAA